VSTLPELYVYQVAAAGDLDADGLDDVIVHEPSTGAPFVIFGKRDTERVVLDDVQAGDGRGFMLGPNWLSIDVVSAGDANGDGFDDLAVLDHLGSSLAGEFNSGTAYVSFGMGSASEPIDVDAIAQDGSRGFIVYGADESDGAWYWPVASAGDTDGDGLDDLLIGAAEAHLGLDPRTEGPCLIASCKTGMAYLVFGRRSPIASRPASLLDFEQGATGGLAIQGVKAADWTGTSVAGAADINGDGLDDMVVGAPGDFYSDDPRRPLPDVGRVFALFGRERNGLEQVAGPRAVLIGGSSDDVLSYDGVAKRGRINGGHGRDTLRIAGATTVLLDTVQEGALMLGESGEQQRTTYVLRATSVEVIDLTSAGATDLRLDDAAVRRIPQSRRGLPFGLAKTLTVLGGAEDRLLMDLSGYELAGENEGRQVYRRSDAFYGLEVSPELPVSAP
jgi:hypothetical protein